MTVRIKPMGRELISDAVNLERVCFSNPWSKNSFISSMNTGNTIFFVAFAEDVFAGYCGVHHVLDEGFVTNVAVHPDFRGRGIGRLLVKELCIFANELNLSSLSLEARESNNTAINLYLSEGFEKIGLRKSFYENPIEDGIIMTKYFKDENK